MSILKPDDWDLVDEASFESFPASDPPAYGSFHAAPSRSTIFPEEPEAPEAPVERPLGAATRIPDATVRDLLMVAAGLAGLFLIASRLRRRWD